MVLTSQVCPMVSHLTEQVKRRVEGLNGIRRLRLRFWMSPGTGTTLSGSRRQRT